MNKGANKSLPALPKIYPLKNERQAGLPGAILLGFFAVFVLGRRLDAIFLVEPLPEINETAALRAKRPVGISFPFGKRAACRTRNFHGFYNTQPLARKKRWTRRETTKKQTRSDQSLRQTILKAAITGKRLGSDGRTTQRLIPSNTQGLIRYIMLT